MKGLVVRDLAAAVETDTGLLPILTGVDLDIQPGSVHALMGPNGSGKSTLTHVLMGRPGYVVTRGEASLDGQSLLELPTFERARAGMFATFQYPVAVPGVLLEDALLAGGRGTSQDRIVASLEAVDLDRSFADRGLNVEFSGGEMKRVETVQLQLSGARVAILDEIDSGLDVDAVEVIAAHVNELVAQGLGVLIITHYRRLLDVIVPNHVHVFREGRIVGSGGVELVDAIETSGYDQVVEMLEAEPAR